MGDAINENVWEGEDEVDLTRTINSDDEIDSEDDVSNNENTSVVDKKSKRKAKFDAMKEKKRLKLSMGEDDDILLHKQLNAQQMVEELKQNIPDDLNLTTINDFPESTFFYPDLEESSAAKSAKGNCPYVRALSAIFPSYKKILLETDNASREKYGCPILLIICPSAQRATEIIKSVSSKLIKCKIAKLFAKHFKVQEQIEMLDSEYFPIAVGTPNRISKLIELGALSLKHTKVVLVDATPDAKKYNILSLHEVKHDFYRLLYKEVYADKNHLKIALVTQFDSATKTVTSAAGSGDAKKVFKKPYARPTSKKNPQQQKSAATAQR